MEKDTRATVKPIVKQHVEQIVVAVASLHCASLHRLLKHKLQIVCVQVLSLFKQISCGGSLLALLLS